MKVLRDVALGLPGVDEGVACEGTAIEKRTVKGRGKAFLFLGAGDALVKLDSSLAAAKKLASKMPGRLRVRANGGTKITFTDAEQPPMDVLVKWIAESHRLASAAKPEPEKKRTPVLARTAAKKKTVRKTNAK